MAQVTIYLPNDLEAHLRGAAKRAGMSLSAYVTNLTRKSVRPNTWPQSFLAVAGSWEGAWPEIDDPPPDEVDRL